MTRTHFMQLLLLGLVPFLDIKLNCLITKLEWQLCRLEVWSKSDNHSTFTCDFNYLRLNSFTLRNLKWNCCIGVRQNRNIERIQCSERIFGMIISKLDHCCVVSNMFGLRCSLQLVVVFAYLQNFEKFANVR